MKIAQMNFRALKAHVSEVSFRTFMKQFHAIADRLWTLSPKTCGHRFVTLIDVALDKVLQGDAEAKRATWGIIKKRLEPSIVDEVAKLDAAATVEGA